MIFSSIHIIRVKNIDSPVLAFADVSFNTGVQLRDMRLMRGREGEMPFYLRMPMKESKSGDSHSIFNPITADVRQTLTEAIASVYQQAVDADKNDYTVNYEVDEDKPRFENIHIHRFPRNRKLKAFASCVLDGEFSLNRMAIVLDEDTKLLRVVPPNRIIPNGGYASYYRMLKEPYKQLYEAIMGAYTAAALREEE